MSSKLDSFVLLIRENDCLKTETTLFVEPVSLPTTKHHQNLQKRLNGYLLFRSITSLLEQKEIFVLNVLANKSQRPNMLLQIIINISR